MRLLHQWLAHDRSRIPGDNKKPTEAQIREALSGVKCRCGTYLGIVRAVKRAAAMMG